MVARRQFLAGAAALATAPAIPGTALAQSNAAFAQSREKPLVIDIHGHYTTAPKQLQAFRDRQIAGLKDKTTVAKGTLGISDDEIRESLEKNQLRIQRERGIDVVIFSPRAAGMGHHIGARPPAATGRSTATS